VGKITKFCWKKEIRFFPLIKKRKGNKENVSDFVSTYLSSVFLPQFCDVANVEIIHKLI
jgi:hypothetical protein